MTERKQPGTSFASFVERQIAEAEARGAFRDLPGAGRPLKDDTAPYDENWWVKAKLEREGVSVLPPGLALRRLVEAELEQLHRLPTEQAVRTLVSDLNRLILDELLTPHPGPPLGLKLLRADELVATWRERRASAERTSSPPPTPVAPTPVAPTPAAPTPAAPTPVAPTPGAPTGVAPAPVGEPRRRWPLTSRTFAALLVGAAAVMVSSVSLVIGLAPFVVEDGADAVSCGPALFRTSPAPSALCSSTTDPYRMVAQGGLIVALVLALTAVLLLMWSRYRREQVVEP